MGDLTETELENLLALASGGVSSDAERPETLQMIQTLAAEIDALRVRVEALEGGSGEKSEYPAWKPWNGISKDYEIGAIISHNGKLWQSVFNGQNVWEPGATGTDDMWHILGVSPDSCL